MTRDGDQVRFHHYQPGLHGAGQCHNDLYAIVVTVSMLRRFLGPGWNPQGVRLLATSADMVGDDGVFADVEVRLSQSHSSFTMPLATLRQVIPAALRYRDVVPSPVTALEPDVPSCYLESVESVVASLMMAGTLDIEIVAAAAGTSTRTLQRRLQASGLSYSAVVQSARIGLASDWLEGTELPIGDIAAMLGYRDPAHFSRAFQRWASVSPRQYRQSFR